MKTISFGCKPTDMIYLKHVLPKLLNKEKCQTIRPAWNMNVKIIFEDLNIKKTL